MQLGELGRAARCLQSLWAVILRPIFNILEAYRYKHYPPNISISAGLLLLWD